jgi:hypothetical protein
MRKRLEVLARLTAVLLSAAACASRGGITAGDGTDGTVVLNGYAVIASAHQSLLDFLLDRAGASRLARYMDSGDQPLLLVDGIQLQPIRQRLADIPAWQVDSVALLRPVEAAMRFGPIAQFGAVVVRMKNGR